VAFGQPTQAEIAAPDYPMGFDGILSIAGTTGIETAVITQKRTETGLVALDNKNEQATH
jgi:hypothetical protein